MEGGNSIAEPLSPISDEEYEAPTFLPSRLIQAISDVPRFGHSNSIAFAASGDDNARQDYLEGASIVSALILLTLVVWLIILFVLKVMGSSHVGCASGKPPTYPSLESIQAANHTLEREYEADAGLEADGKTKGEENHEDMEQWLQEVQIIEKRIRSVRVTFLVCGFAIIPASLVLIAAGFRVLDGAFKQTQANVLATQYVIDNNLQRVNALITTNKQAIAIRDAATDDLASWCPNTIADDMNLIISADGVPSTLDFVENEDGTRTVTFYNETENLITSLDELEDIVVSGSERVEEALLIARQHTVKINDTFEDASWWFYLAIVVAVVIDIFAIIFMVGVCLAWTYRSPKCFERVQTFALFPIFGGIIFLLWLCASGFALTMVFNADICSGSPEENVVAILHQKATQMNPLLYDMASYYIQGCTLKDGPDKPTESLGNFSPLLDTEDRPYKPTVLFDNFLPYLESSIGASQRFTSKMAAIDMSSLSRACGLNIKGTTNTMAYLLQTLNEVQERTNFMIEGLYCSNFNPIFSKYMYEGICDDGIRGLVAIFASLFVIVIAGMTMLSLRVASHEVRNESNWIDELGLNAEYNDVVVQEEEAISEDISEIEDDGLLHEA